MTFIFIGLLLSMSANLPTKSSTYALISCNHVLNCEQAGKFQELLSCLAMKKQLESMSNMNAYVCEKSFK